MKKTGWLHQGGGTEKRKFRCREDLGELSPVKYLVPLVLALSGCELHAPTMNHPTNQPYIVERFVMYEDFSENPNYATTAMKAVRVENPLSVPIVADVVCEDRSYTVLVAPESDSEETLDYAFTSFVYDDYYTTTCRITRWDEVTE